MAFSSINCCSRVLFCHGFGLRIEGEIKPPKEEPEMFYKAMGNAHSLAVVKSESMRRKAVGQAGQGTVEYVGLILLVSLLMVGMVAAMKGFSGRQGTELAELIVDKIQSAVDKIAFR